MAAGTSTPVSNGRTGILSRGLSIGEKESRNGHKSAGLLRAADRQNERRGARAVDSTKANMNVVVREKRRSPWGDGNQATDGGWETACAMDGKPKLGGVGPAVRE